MLANYHSHTVRCGHATGTQREFVEKAIEAGFRIFGFSDHTPYPFDNGYVSGIRMRPEELEDYVKETLDLRREYRRDIDIRLGLEAEYYPRHFEALLRLIEPYPIEYLLLAQHATCNEYDGVYSGRPTGDEDVLAAYCAQIKTALETGRFLYLAHPDLVNYTGSAGVYERYMRDLCRFMKARGVSAEINFLGLKEERNYPNPAFWKIAGEEGVDAVLGVDAHHLHMIDLPECEERALRLAKTCGLRVIERVL